MSIYIETDSVLINVAAKMGMVICLPPILILLRIISDEEKKKIKDIFFQISNKIFSKDKTTNTNSRI